MERSRRERARLRGKVAVEAVEPGGSVLGGGAGAAFGRADVGMGGGETGGECGAGGFFIGCWGRLEL